MILFAKIFTLSHLNMVNFFNLIKNTYTKNKKKFLTNYKVIR